MKHICMLAPLCFAVGFAAPAGAADEPAPGAAFSQPQSVVAVETPPQAPTNWAAVRVGMTKEEVRQLLGEPRSVFPSPSQLVTPVVKSLLTPDRWWPECLMMAIALAINPATYGGAKGYHEGWEYPRDRSPVFDDIYYVYLDENGKVVRLSKPSDPDRRPLINRTGQAPEK